MERNATISILNLTDETWTYKSDDVKHGKYVRKPPKTIEPDVTASFEVGLTSGFGGPGPEGTVTYSVPKGYTVTIYWNHPYGTADSSYEAYSDPVGKITYTLTPPHPSGHNQAVTLTVSRR